MMELMHILIAAMLALLLLGKRGGKQMFDYGKRIVYPTDNNSIAIIIPCDCGLSIEEIAKKDVPNGVKYKIIDSSELPTDRSTRDAWTIDFGKYDGIGGK